MDTDNASEHDGAPTRPPRVRPGIAPALAVFVAYLLAILGLSELFASDVPYNEIASTRENFIDGAVLPIGVVSLALAAVTTYFGWWRPVLTERRTVPNWLLIWPVVAIVSMIANIAVDSDQWDTDFLVMVFIGFAFVGFSEELMTRGLLLIGARSQYRELWSWLISTACFGAMHSLNAIDGQEIGTTAVQVVATFGSGTLLYFARRIGGTLLLPMLMHALFDITLVVHTGPGGELNAQTASPAPAAAAFQTLGAIFLVIALVKRYLVRTNPGPEIEPLLDASSERTSAAGTG